MYQFGIGFKSTVQAKEDIEKEKERKTIVEFIIDETLIKVGNQYAWLCMGCYYRTSK
jgi:transposase-like protein